MKRSGWIISTALILALTLIGFPLAAQQARGQTSVFVIQGADASNTLTMSGLSALTSLIQTIESRLVIQFANASNTFPLSQPPAGLTNLLQSAENRIILEFANASKISPLTQPPANLTALLQSVEERFVVEFANSTQATPLAYPLALIGDQIAPTITGVSTLPSGGGLAFIVQTNEYTQAQLNYGLVSGAYLDTLVDDEWRTEHRFTLGGLQQGVTYYYQVTVTDRSGNSTLSAEGTFSASNPLFLPFVVKAP